MIYFDEAGNSGDNLLDTDQPVYLLLSHNFTDLETEDILRPLFNISKATELHFKSVKKYSTQRNTLIECLRHPLIREGRVHFYKGAQNLILANMLYILGSSEWDNKFAKWTRTASFDDSDIFCNHAKNLYNTLFHERDKWLLGLIIESRNYQNEISDSFEKYGTDAPLSCFVEHCNYWNKIYSTPLNILFDNSKQIAYWRTLIIFLNNLPNTEV